MAVVLFFNLLYLGIVRSFMKSSRVNMWEKFRERIMWRWLSESGKYTDEKKCNFAFLDPFS